MFNLIEENPDNWLPGGTSELWKPKLFPSLVEPWEAHPHELVIYSPKIARIFNMMSITTIICLVFLLKTGTEKVVYILYILVLVGRYTTIYPPQPRAKIPPRAAAVPSGLRPSGTACCPRRNFLPSVSGLYRCI